MAEQMAFGTLTLSISYVQFSAANLTVVLQVLVFPAKILILGLLAPLLMDFKDPLLHKAKTPMKLVYLTKDQAIYVIGKYTEKFATENNSMNLASLLEAVQSVPLPETKSPSPVSSPKLESAHSIERLLNPPTSPVNSFPPTTKMMPEPFPTLPPLISAYPKPYLPPPITFPSNYALPFWAGKIVVLKQS